MATPKRPSIAYRNVSPGAWTGETARDVLRLGGSDALLVMQYLMTCPFTTMLGVYRVPVGYMGAETGLGDTGAAKGLRACIRAGFCSYDPESAYVFVHNFARWQLGEQLDPADKRCKGVANAYAALPENPYLAAFFDRYAQDFHLPKRRMPRRRDDDEADLFSPLVEAPPKPGSGSGSGSGSGPGPGPLPVGRGSGGTAETRPDDEPPADPPVAAPPPAPPSPAAPAPQTRAKNRKPGPKAKPAGPVRSRRVPTAWLVSVELQHWARATVVGLDIRGETEAFRDHEFADPHSDWDAAWRNWMRRAFRTQGRPGTRPPTRPPQSVVEARNIHAADAWAGAAPSLPVIAGATP